MKKCATWIALCAALAFPATVLAQVPDYAAVEKEYKEGGQILQRFTLDDGIGGTVTALANERTVYTAAENVVLYGKPGEAAEMLAVLPLGQELEQVAVCDNGFCKVKHTDAQGESFTGYVKGSLLDEEPVGSLHKSCGDSVFSQADEQADGEGTEESDAEAAGITLKSLGTFRVTYYCPCSECCGPWSDGITSTGVTAVTNHTIAVDPNQIPYGSQVVIDGQVYVAEDCGGAITEGCIDIYVATHAEAEQKGVRNLEVYLIEE